VTVLSYLGQVWVLASALVAAGLLYLGDIAAQSQANRGGTERFLLNVLSLPTGVVVLIGIGVRWSQLGTIPAVIGLVVGAVLVGRSLREVPWTGVISVVAGALAAYAAERYGPGSLSDEVLVAVGAIVFLLVYVILYIIEIPLRLAGILSIPRIFLALLAVASFIGAALVYVL
jgi:hypothetical protein